MNTINIGLVQMRCEKGALDDNLAAIRSYLQEAASRNVDILCFPEMSITGYANPYTNPRVVAHGGKLLSVYRKKTIAGDEKDWFAPGTTVQVVQHRATTFGVAICADIDTPEIFAQQARQGARIIFEAAAPGLYGEQETRNWRSGYEWWQSECHQKLGRYARENDIFIAVATQAGRTIDEDFPGGGYIFGPNGACLLSTEDWSENVLYAELPIA